MTAYEFFKDFAGPLATVLAAGSAVFVTFTLGRRQAAAAERQSETARNKLMADIFDRRFATYEGAMKVSGIALFVESEVRFEDTEFHELAHKALQGEFLFPPSVFPLIKQIVDQSYDLVAKEGRLALRTIRDPKYDEQHEAVANLHIKLMADRQALPEKIRPYMRLDFH